jgi:hypothetical protein
LISKKSCWSPAPAWQHMTTRKSGNTVSSHKAQTDCSCPSIIQPRSCSLRFPPLWSPQKMPCMGESLGVTFIGYWRSEQVATCTALKLVCEGERCSCFSLVQGFLSLWRLSRKMRCLIHPASHPVSKFIEFYNKFPATLKMMLQNFWASFVWSCCTSACCWADWHSGFTSCPTFRGTVFWYEL